MNPDNEKRETPLGKLKYEEFIHIRKFYPENTPWVRAVFCLLAVIISLWDFMLLCTVLYFHMMIEKVVASGLAVLSWFALYKFFYRQDFSPGLPGSGPFKYSVLFRLPKLIVSSDRGPLRYNVPLEVNQCSRTALRWFHLNWLQVFHQEVPFVLVAILATRWRLALVTNLATRWCHSHWFQI